MVKLFANEREIQAKNGLMLVFTYAVLMIVNSAVVYLAHLMFPAQVVLGTFALTSGWALCLAMGKLSLIGTLVMPFVTYKEWKSKKDFQPKDWMSLYFVVNALGLWVITRYAEIYGLGVSSWVVIVVLAAVLDMVQGMAMMQLGKVKIK
jgi:hypothetical protein